MCATEQRSDVVLAAGRENVLDGPAPAASANVHTADPSPAGAPSARYAVRCRLVALYMQHNPANIRNIDALLDQHQGQELVLFEKLFMHFNGTGDIARHPAAASTLAHRAEGHQQLEATAAQAGPSVRSSATSCGWSRSAKWPLNEFPLLGIDVNGTSGRP